jgi:hypothetical protein
MKLKGSFIPLLFYSFLLFLFYFGFLIGRDFIWDDQLFVHYPLANYLAKSIASGRFPLWSPSVRCGFPFYSDIGAAVFYPPNWFLSLFVRNGILPFLVYQWHLVFQLFLGGFFMFLFLKEIRINDLAALLGTIIFSFCGFMSLQFIHPTFTATVIWCPLQLLFVKKIFNNSKNIKFYFCLSAVLLLSLLAGAPQIALYNFLLVFSYWLFNLKESASPSPKKIGREFLKFIIACILFTSVAAPALFPAFQNWRLSTRGGQDFQNISELSLPPYYLINLLVPNFWGTLPQTTCEGKNLVPFWGFLKNINDYLAFKKGFWQYWEFGSYAGQISLIAFLMLLFNIKIIKQKKESVFFLGWSVFSLWFMLGRYGGLFFLLYNFIPGIAAFRTPARMAVGLNFSLATLGAFLVEELFRKNSLDFKKTFATLSALYFLMILGFWLFWKNLFYELNQKKLWCYSLEQTLISLGFFLIIFLTIWLISRTTQQKTKIILAVFLILLAYADLFLSYNNFHKGTKKPDYLFTVSLPLSAKQLEQLKKTRYFRFAQLINGKIKEEVVAPRNAAFFYKTFEVPEGYLLFTLKNISDFNQIKNTPARLDIQNVCLTANLEPDSNCLIFSRNKTALPRFKFYTKIKKYDSRRQILADIEKGQLDYQKEIAVYSHDLPPLLSSGGRFDKDPGTFNITIIKPEEIKISYNLKKPGILFISQTYYPGWKVIGGDFKVIEVFGAFLGIVFPSAGTGELRLVFHPDILYICCLISCFSLVAVLIIGYFLRAES